MIWYVAYGSNLLAARFAEYVGSVDRPSRRVTIPHPRYFARASSGRWGAGGVAFLDPYAPGAALGRAWLLTDDELTALHAAEGPWYDLLLDLDPVDGRPARTFTASERLPDNPPGAAYADVVRRGEEETRRLPA